MIMTGKEPAQDELDSIFERLFNKEINLTTSAER